MRDVRLIFEKRGLLRFVSHLDLNRAVLRCLRRTDIPIWYTEGFNPHPYVTFALPLPLGAESVNDVLDLRVVGDIKNREIVEKLNAVLPDGLRITGSCEPRAKIRELCKAEYLFFFSEATDMDRVRAIVGGGELMSEKPGKAHGRKVMKTVNLLEEVYACAYDGHTMKLTLPAGSVKNVNPISLAEELEKKDGSVDCRLVRRTELLTETGAFR
ncbi:MAG: DUF2344 domain-containing protein [Clostridia bacterium]|nr:DUF2344 domain-containing protein [Clostridia bacterium]